MKRPLVLLAVSIAFVALLPVVADAQGESGEEMVDLTRQWQRELGLGKLAVGVLGTLALVALLRRPGQGRSPKDWVAPVGALGAWIAGLVAGARGWLNFFELGTGAAWTLAIGSLVPVALAGGLLHARRRSGRAWRSLHERLVLVVVGASGVFAWTQFGGFHGASHFVHHHDTFHYYVGSRYFPELRYTGLYAATVQAEVEDAGPEALGGRRVRDLQSNEVRPAAEILREQSQEVRAQFDEARWRAFAQDVRVFRSRADASSWGLLLRDHGYNPTPLWTLIGGSLAGWGAGDLVPPKGLEYSAANAARRNLAQQQAITRRFVEDREAHADHLFRLAVLDLLLYGACFALLGWAFGARSVALALLLWGVGDAWSFQWTGGGFLRTPWLLAAVAGVCALRKGRPMLAGAALATTGLLRAFPLLLSLGVVIQGAVRLLRTRRIDRASARMAAGAAGAVLLLVLLSSLVCGFGAWAEFLDNSQVHRGTPLSNHIGLGTLVAYSPGESYEEVLERVPMTEALEVWKDGRIERLQARRPLEWALILGLGTLVVLAILKVSPWRATALSTAFLFLFFDLTSYYYVFLLLFAPLAITHGRRLIACGAFVVASQLSALALESMDLRFELQSLLTLLFLATMALEHWRGPAEVEAAG